MRYLLVLGSIGCAFACTTICVGKGGTVDGSVIGVHTNDGEGDAVGNIHKILAADHTPGSIRPPGVLEVNHTYGYLSEGYPSMNEYQVGLAESTCSAVYVATSVAQGGKALLNIVQLGQIGLERAKTARETITVMGAIAEQYGYHGGGGYEGSGESLLVTDPNEAYIFHILPDFSQSAAIWVAQRVPDDHMAVVANCFTIRDVTLNDTQTFLFSSNLQDEAKRLGWTPAPTLDFTLLFSKGEYGHKYYSGRREWYAFLKLGDTPLPANYTDLVASKPYVDILQLVLPFFFEIHFLVTIQAHLINFCLGQSLGFLFTSSVVGRRVLCAFIRMAGIVRGSVGGACINNFTLFFIFYQKCAPRDGCSTAWLGFIRCTVTRGFCISSQLYLKLLVFETRNSCSITNFLYLF